jgi:hypothetical protein
MEVRVVEDEKKNCLLNHFNSCKKSGESVRGDIPPTIIPKGLHLFDDVL